MGHSRLARWAAIALGLVVTPAVTIAQEPLPAPLTATIVGTANTPSPAVDAGPTTTAATVASPVDGVELVSACTWATPVAPPACGAAGCGGTCGTDGTGGLLGALGNLIQPSDTAFCNFVSPISNPLFFEDPRTLSEVRVIFANHWLPQSNPVFQGGQAQYLAAQIRVALTERLSLVANKDGYIWIDPDNPALENPDGWADVAAGLKYNLVRDPAQQWVLSVGTIFELDVGSHRVFQGRGDGEFHLFATNGIALSEKSHWLTATGFRLPTDTAARSQMWYWSNHVDYNVFGRWYAIVEANWFHYMKSGQALPVSFEGGDLFNLGATDVAGNDLVTMAFGARRKLWQMSELGIGYELPVSNRQDIISSRIYCDLILRY